MMMKNIIVAAALLAIASCGEKTAEAPAPNGPAGSQKFTLERTPCFGFCPVYKATVGERDRVFFDGERYVTETEEVLMKQLPAGSFKKLIEIAEAHDFASFDEAYPNEDGSNCPQMATDLPGVIISFETDTLTHSVRLDGGCFGFDGRERFDEMAAEIDAVLALDDWIGPREDFYGAKD